MPVSTPDVVIGQHIHKGRLRGGEEKQAASLSSDPSCAAHAMNVFLNGNGRVVLQQTKLHFNIFGCLVQSGLEHIFDLHKGPTCTIHVTWARSNPRAATSLAKKEKTNKILILLTNVHGAFLMETIYPLNNIS